MVNSFSMEEKFNLPFEIAGGIKLENQAQFHPLKYIYGFFVNDAIPKISKKIYNKKIEEYFRNKQI